ncbi:protein S100-B-like isoform X1 [Lepisosteus oculatus]|uniref:protein S100-B-like isoform X1 n=1 Tax=Lepisosteus oculatus TaxID=7918 RepID=UPI00074006E3|nr:PREDICTED: protein S100-B-like isoform X1 [Lepisosteus oculatus]
MFTGSFSVFLRERKSRRSTCCFFMANEQRNMSELENSMVSIIKVFHKYSGHKRKLKKAELKELINNEMSHFILPPLFPQHSPNPRSLPLPRQKIQEPDTLDQLFTDLDQNGDLEIDFQEFIALVAMVTSACHELFIPDHRG